MSSINEFNKLIKKVIKPKNDKVDLNKSHYYPYKDNKDKKENDNPLLGSSLW